MALPLPSALHGFTQSERWVTWKWVTKANGSKTKEPFRARFPAMHASTNQPSTWAPFSAALKTYQSGLADGVGYVVREDEDHIFLDLDKCRDPATGEVAPWAMTLVEEANSYTEITPSGTGLRIIGTKGWIANPIHAPIVDPDGHEIEVYFRAGRYVTVSGVPLPGTPDQLNDISEVTIGVLERGGTKRIRPGQEPEERKSNIEPTRSIEAVRAALAAIPNDRQDWHHWSMVGMATWRTTGGSAEGREAWRNWSARNPIHDDADLDERWRHWFISPPTKLGFGTLYHLARRARPLFVAPYDPVLGDPPPFEEAGAHAQAQNKPSRPRILSIAEIEALPPPVWLVEGLVPERGLVMPYGPPKKGKTFIALSLALHIAAGLEWMGRAVTQGGVVYIAGEGVGGLGLRIKAMRAHYGISDRVPFWVVPKAVNFSDPAAVADLIKLVRDTVLDEPISLVVVDTLARAAPGVEENSSKEMGVVIASCDAVRDALECTVMPIHHAGKDEAKGLRGSSAIHGAVDASFHITGTGKSVTLTPVDQKEADPGPPMVFEMLEVMVGIGRNSLVPVLVEANQGQDHSRQDTDLSPQEALAIRALNLALERCGTWGQFSNVPASIPVVKDTEWREAYRSLRAGDDWETSRKAFQRVSRSLITRRIVGCHVPYVWKVRDDGPMQQTHERDTGHYE